MSGTTAAAPTLKRRRASPTAHPIFIASGSSSDEEGDRPEGAVALSLGNVIVRSPGRPGGPDAGDPPSARRRVESGAGAATLAPPPHPASTHPAAGAGARPKPIAGEDKPGVMEVRGGGEKRERRCGS